MTMSSETLRNMLVKQEPRAVSCCYVCSGGRADYPIYSKPCGDRPFFPFLEHHQPPEGAEFITYDGKVLVCSLCYAFLTQQWDTYERTKTPHSKRIYWLKRLDNGAFAGMEVNLQQDYESLFDASDYEPRQKSKSSRNSQTPQLESKKANKYRLPERSDSRESTSSGFRFIEKVEIQESCVNNALDLSMPSRTPSQSSSTLPSPPEIINVCFVCGMKSKTLLNVFAKPIANCPYFPNLIFHVKPMDAKPMDESGRVRTCEHCHRSLIQQWDYYQKRNIPISERVYQLKFDGSANVQVFKQEVPQTKKSFVCFTCGMTASLTAQRLLRCYSDKDGDSYFSFLLHINPPSGAEALKDGKAKVCSLCYKSLFRQLKVFEMSSVPEEHRKYKIHDNSSEQPSIRQQLKRSGSQQNLHFENCCYLCEKISGVLCPVSTVPCNDMYFPFIRDLKKQFHAECLSDHGYVKVCKECHLSLKYQWDAFEHAKIPINQRQYKVIDAKLESAVGLISLKSDFSSPSEAVSSNGLCNSNSKSTISNEMCCICKRYLVQNEVFILDSLPRQDGMYFPFLGTYLKPNAKHVDQSGKVLACRKCHLLLKNQWEYFESARIPHSHRQYHVFPPVAEKDTKHNIAADPNLHTANSVLHVQVSTPNVSLSTKGPLNSEPLLTTVNTYPVTNIITSSALSSNLCTIPKTCDNKLTFNKLSSVNDSSSIARICGPLDVPFGRPLLLNSVCFVCGEQSASAPMYSVNAVPSVSQSAPFFPFLSKHGVPEGAEKLTEDGTALVCMFCYHSMVSQFLAYESSTLSEDSNPWYRRYNTHNYVCYICGTVTYRQRVCSISVHDFPFLLHHPRPPGALTLLGGECVVTCLTCFESIMAQWKDFERMKVPVEMRKYNWIVLPAPLDDDRSRGCQILNAQETMSSNRGSDEDVSMDSRISANSSYDPGLSHNSKPPPHLPVQPVYASKPISRAIASASPIHSSTSHSSATYNSLENSTNSAINATRTSSFAAALRKLAKQAIDPVTERESMPVSSPAANQQSLGSKRIATPNSYMSSGHVSSLSANSSLPRVPTPSFPNSRNIEKRKSIDFGRYANSHTLTEAVNFKLDHPESVNVADESRSDNVDQRHSPMQLTQQPSYRSRDEHNLPSRGFQPYRNSEDSISSTSSQIYNPGSSSNVSGYPYHPSLYPPTTVSHPYRLEESLYMERFGMIQPPAVAYPSSTNVLPYPGMPFYSNSRYPPDLLVQHSGVNPTCNPVHRDERIKSEEDFRENEAMHARERRLESENDQELYRYREKEYRERGQDVLMSEKDHRIYNVPALSRNSRVESPLVEPNHARYESPHDLYIHKKSPSSSSSSGALNLVKQVSPASAYQDMPPNMWHRSAQHGSSSQSYVSSFKHDNSSYDAKFRPPPLISELHPDAQNQKHLRVPENSPNVNVLALTKNISPCSSRDYRKEESKEFYGGNAPPNGQANGSHAPPHDPSEYAGYDPSASFRAYKQVQNHRQVENWMKYRYDPKNGPPLADNQWLHHEKISPFPPQHQPSDKEDGFQTHRSVPSPADGSYKLSETPSQPPSFHPSASKESSITRALLQNPITPSVIERYVHATEEVHPRIVSKLDVRENKIRNLRSNAVAIVSGCELSDSESEDEVNLKMKEFLIITKGPPAKFDANIEKQNFLKSFNLVTIPKKQAVEWRKYMKRRRVLRERSIAPKCEETENQIQFDPKRLSELSHRLCVEDRSERKLEFFQMLGLKHVSSQTLRQRVPDSRADVIPKLKAEYVENSHSLADVPVVHFKKRRTLLSGLQRSSTGKYNSPIHDTGSPINGIVTSSCYNLKVNESVPFSKLYTSPEASLPPLIPNEMLNVSKPEPIQNSGKAIVRSQDPRVKLLDKSFAQEFHESVLQATQMQLGQKLGPNNSASQQKSPTQTASASEDKKRKSVDENRFIFKWPGIEAIMESYESHIFDQNMEKDFLAEMCKKLQAKNQELNTQTVCLGRKTAELVQLKTILDADRQSLTGSMNHLQVILQNFR